jgi:hypothetical protein
VFAGNDTNGDFVDTSVQALVGPAKKNMPFPVAFLRADARTRTGDPDLRVKSSALAGLPSSAGSGRLAGRTSPWGLTSRLSSTRPFSGVWARIGHRRAGRRAERLGRFPFSRPVVRLRLGRGVASSPFRPRPGRAPKTTIGRVAIEFPVQRLQIGDVVALSEQGSEVEATVAREIDRTELTVRVTLRVEGREDFIKEWPVGEMVTVIRGP